MKTFPAKTGPFAKQPFFKLDEIEAICSDELRKVDLYPIDPEPIRIDRFIEKRFGIHPTYDDLPNGLLGFTLFTTNGVAEIVVAKALDELGTVPAERRLRTTMAHEASHGLLHAHLFAFATRPDSLFGDGLASDTPKILCRDGGVSGVEPAPKRPPYRWWEFQANQAMGALLLPKTLVEQAVAPMLSFQGLLGLPVLPDDCRDHAVRLVAETFNVNPIVARIRLEVLYPASATRQLTL